MFVCFFTPVYKYIFSTCVRCILYIRAYVSVCVLFMLSTVWPSLVLPAVLTLVCVDSKHSCRSQRPRSGQTRGSEGQWGREHTGSVNAGKGKTQAGGKANLCSSTA